MEMEYDRDKVDEMVLALLWLTTFDERFSTRAWKGHDWAAMDRLFEKGYIHDPRSKAKSVVLTEEGIKRSKELFDHHFARPRS
jgi:hypothetical protein